MSKLFKPKNGCNKVGFTDELKPDVVKDDPLPLHIF